MYDKNGKRIKVGTVLYSSECSSIKCICIDINGDVGEFTHDGVGLHKFTLNQNCILDGECKWLVSNEEFSKEDVNIIKVAEKMSPVIDRLNRKSEEV